MMPYFNIENPPPQGPQGQWPTTGLMDARAKMGLSHAMIDLDDMGGQDDCPSLSVVAESSVDDIQKFLAVGGEVLLSVNGSTCANAPGGLAGALTDIMRETGIHELDFDVEDTFLASQPDTDRRNQAIVALQKEFPDLFVSFTLGAAPKVKGYNDTDPTQYGLVGPNLSLVKATLAAGVRIDRITIMPFSMGFPKSIYDQYGFYRLDELAVDAVADQMEVLFSPDPAHPIPRWKIYSMIGVLPALGEGVGEPADFYQRDALLLGEWSRDKGLGMISYYVFQRDQAQSSFGPFDDTYLSRFSGVPQTDYEFYFCFEGFGACPGDPGTPASEPPPGLGQ